MLKRLVVLFGVCLSWSSATEAAGIQLPTCAALVNFPVDTPTGYDVWGDLFGLDLARWSDADMETLRVFLWDCRRQDPTFKYYTADEYFGEALSRFFPELTALRDRKAAEADLDSKGATLLAQITQIEERQTNGSMTEADLAAAEKMLDEVKALQSRNLELSSSALSDAVSTAERIIVNYKSELEMGDFVARSNVNDALGFSFDDLSGWWRYADAADGCGDIEDNQYRAALGRYQPEDGQIAFGRGQQGAGFYDASCGFSDERVVDGKIVLTAQCTSEGTDYTGDAQIEVLAGDTIKLSTPVMSPTLVACPGTINRALPRTVAQATNPSPLSPSDNDAIQKISPYFAQYIVARECSKNGVVFSAEDMKGIDGFMKQISDQSSASKEAKDLMWRTMTGAIAGTPLQESDCYAARQWMQSAMPASAFSSEAFPF